MTMKLQITNLGPADYLANVIGNQTNVLSMGASCEVYCHSSQDVLVTESLASEHPQSTAGVTPMTFETALAFAKQGYQIARYGWNGPNQFVNAQRPDANSKMGAPYMYLRNAQGTNVPWVPSQGDLFADDWMVLSHG